MLQKIFALSIIFIIILIVLTIVKIAVPIWRFMIRADAIIQLYNELFKFLLKKEFCLREKIKVSHGKYVLEFVDVNEASIQFEKMIDEALEYYDKLGWIATVDDTFKVQRDELIDICSKVRVLRWKMQKN